MIAAQRPIALTMGEPAGIGGEITLKAWLGRKRSDIPPFFVIDDPDRLSRLAARLDWTVPVRAIDRPAEALECFESTLPVLARPLASTVMPGQPDPANAGGVLRAIEEAARLAMAEEVAAIVTNPIHKGVLYKAGFRHPGHTEYFFALSGTCGRAVMMLACPGLRVVPVTIHTPLAEAVVGLRREDIVTVARVTAEALVRDFAVPRPHLAIAALNPHAGESGTMGREEIEIIAPAVAELKRHGVSASGPAPADTLFHERARATYDAAICMYHDQALIPVKTINFREGVNITLGLPFIRTSPNHGTAFEIAGTGVADESSLVAALKTAHRMVTCRTAHRESEHHAVG